MISFLDCKHTVTVSRVTLTYVSNRLKTKRKARAVLAFVLGYMLH